MSALASFRDTTLGYGRRPAVHHLHGEIRRGELLAVVGPNGAGKSTLLKGLAGLLKPLEGRIELSGLKQGDIAYLPQLSDTDRSFPIDVWGLVAFGAYARCGVFAALSRKAKGRIREAIEAVGLTGFERRPIATLSGGQAQRALFARTMVQDAKLILLDEPLNAIDAATSAQLMVHLRSWSDEGRAVIAVLHDFDIVAAHFPSTLLLAREPIEWGATGSVLRPHNVARARQMVEAWREDARVCRQGEAA